MLKIEEKSRGEAMFEHNKNDELFYITELVHPSFVYACTFFEDEEANGAAMSKMVVTACYDQKIRIWQVKVSGSNELLKRPLCIMALDVIDLNQMENRLNKKDMEFMRNPLLTKYIHPNCIAFDDSGRIFVGDSIGYIRCWDISIYKGKVTAQNEFAIRSDELEDDPITQIRVDPQ